MKLEITKSASDIRVKAPYHALFVRQARKHGGNWIAPTWVFDGTNESRVRDLCRKYYGCDGVTSDFVTLRVTFNRAAQVGKGPICVAGRPIARAFGRDSGARLGDGVILLKGWFSSGGSIRYWKTTVEDGTAILVRDFPRTTAEKLIAKSKAGDMKSFAIEIE